MKKVLIATLVGAVILFFWQFLAWSMLPVHQAEYGYSANQDRIMEALNQNLTEDGTYYLPNVAPGTSNEASQAFMESNAGKPWASISYHKAYNANMGMNMTRGMAADLLAVFLLVWLLLKFQTLDLKTALQASLFVGIIGYLTIPYLNSIWFDTNSIGYLVDAIVPWGLVGLWLGWWLPRK